MEQYQLLEEHQSIVFRRYADNRTLDRNLMIFPLFSDHSKCQQEQNTLNHKSKTMRKHRYGFQIIYNFFYI